MDGSSYVLVWDLDHTLGVFDSLEHIRDPMEPATVQLRPGIDKTLERLSAAGFCHTVLTLASPLYAEMALRGTGLRHHFLEVAGAGVRSKGDAHGIAHSLGLPVERCAERMAFIGDHLLFDAPQDTRVVFHLEAQAQQRDAALVVTLLHGLREYGQGSLRAGFDVLCAQGEDDGPLRRGALSAAGQIIMAVRQDASPVVAFDDDTLQAETDHSVSFIPAEVDFASKA